MKTLVIGMGNLLLCDEGVGVHAAQALLAEPIPDGVAVLDVGTAILEALPAMETADRVIVIDAMKAGGSPGSVYRIPYEECSRPDCIASMHGFDLSRVMALTGRNEHPQVIIIGVEPAVIDWSMDLSPALKRSLPHVLKAVKDEISHDVPLWNGSQ